MPPAAPRSAAGTASVAAGAVVQVVGRRRLQRMCRRAGVVALSYDDGPGPGLTPKVLDVLGEREAQATFFPLGRCVAGGEAALDRMLAEGHEVGCHGFAHVHAWRERAAATVRDIDAGYEALAPWAAPDAVFRPPHGKVTPPTLWALARRRAAPAWWTQDSGDTWPQLPDSESIARSVVAAGGGVVLLHDFDRHPAEPDRDRFVLDVTAAVIDGARTAGLAVRRLGAALAA